VRHYTISWSDGDIGAEAARAVADLILMLTQFAGRSALTQGSTGVFHLLVRPADSG
jgi:hypothetical protein